MKRRIYVASSWRNDRQPSIVAILRQEGHEVYDFKNPAPGNGGFHWSEIDGGWKTWDAERYRQALKHPIAESGFQLDMDALDDANTTVLVLPCGRSAHLEMGYAIGRGHRTIILLDPEHSIEPELMYKMVDHVCLTDAEMVAAVNR